MEGCQSNLNALDHAYVVAPFVLGSGAYLDTMLAVSLLCSP